VWSDAYSVFSGEAQKVVYSFAIPNARAEFFVLVPALTSKIFPIVEMTGMVVIPNGCEESLGFFRETLPKTSPFGRNDSVFFPRKNMLTR
jgi:hypothetical protein